MILPESGYTPLNLITLMSAKKLKAKDVAKMLNVTVETVSNWRTGKATMPSKQWAILNQQTQVKK